MYIDNGSPVLYIPSKSHDLADGNNKIVTEWKWFETTVLSIVFCRMRKYINVSFVCHKMHNKYLPTLVAYYLYI